MAGLLTVIELTCAHVNNGLLFLLLTKVILIYEWVSRKYQNRKDAVNMFLITEHLIGAFALNDE
jgi:hypothetical protein